MNPNTPSEYVNNALSELGEELGTDKILTDQVPRRLFHYTDAAGLKGILASGKLHATDLRFMNDSGELQYARSVIQEVLDGELTNHDSNLGERFRKGIAVLNEMDESWGYYAVCFCQDDDLLSQWRAYGSAGGGYAVGFDGPTLVTRLMNGKVDRNFQRINMIPHRNVNEFDELLRQHFQFVTGARRILPETRMFLRQSRTVSLRQYVGCPRNSFG